MLSQSASLNAHLSRKVEETSLTVRVRELPSCYFALILSLFMPLSLYYHAACNAASLTWHARWKLASAPAIESRRIASHQLG